MLTWIIIFLVTPLTFAQEPLVIGTAVEANQSPWKTEGVADDLGIVAPQKTLRPVYKEITLNKVGETVPLNEVNAKNSPKISYTNSDCRCNNPNSPYRTLIFLDLDVPRRTSPTQRSWLHWLVGNIPGNMIKEGDQIVQYYPPTPAAKSGKHRYVYLVYCQPQHYKDLFKNTIISDNTKGRASFDFPAFVAKYKLKGPCIGNFFITEKK